MPKVPDTFPLYERVSTDGGQAKAKGSAKVVSRYQSGEVQIQSEALLQMRLGTELLALVPAPLNLGKRELWSFTILESNDLKVPYLYVLRFDEHVRRVEDDWHEDNTA